MSWRACASLLMLLLSVSCSQKNPYMKDLEKSWDFEKVLEAETGHKHKIAKLFTSQTGFTVYQDEVTGEFKAYNMNKWSKGSMSSLAQYMANGVVDGVDIVRNLSESREWEESGRWEDIYETRYKWVEEYNYSCSCYEDKYVSYQHYVDREWKDTSSWVYHYSGSGFTFENTAAVSKDLDTFAALKEEAQEAFIAHKLKSELSLSESRAEELARLASRYQRLGSSRELTTSEKNSFAMKALGVSMADVESAIKAKVEGNDGNYEKLLQAAAKTNNTTPEQIGKFFNEMVLEAL